MTTRGLVIWGSALLIAGQLLSAQIPKGPSVPPGYTPIATRTPWATPWVWPTATPWPTFVIPRR